MPKQSTWQKFVHDHAGKGLNMQDISKMYQQQKKERSPNYKGIAADLLQERVQLKQRLASVERERAALKDQLELCQEYMGKTASSSKKRGTV